MLYVAFLMEKLNFVPYRDFFDMNLPGTYWIYYLIGYITGFQDIGIRITDIIILCFMMFITFLWMKRINHGVAIAGATLFGLWYLSFGPKMSLQREYLALALIIPAVTISTSENLKPSLKNMIVGILFGLSATIKPHIAIGLISIVGLEITNAWSISRKQEKSFHLPIWNLFALFCGFSIPILAMLVWLWSQNNLNDFINIALNYWPLYASLNGNHEAISGMPRLSYLVNGFIDLGGNELWLIPTAFGLSTALSEAGLTNQQKRQIILVALLAILYSIYPVFSGQFWFYHWVLFGYFIIQASSLCFVSQNTTKTIGRRLFPIVLLLLPVLFQLHPLKLVINESRESASSSSYDERVNEIAIYLQTNMRPGDKVQPLDWTGGAVHAMLLSRATLATPFIYDFHFYHNISNPFVQNLRGDFIEALGTAQPRFIIQINCEDKPWVSGEDTTHEFEALQKILDQNYVAVSTGDGYQILERK